MNILTLISNTKESLSPYLGFDKLSHSIGFGIESLALIGIANSNTT